jgi:hypothetical protein
MLLPAQQKGGGYVTFTDERRRCCINLSATVALGHENLSRGPPFCGGAGLRRWTLQTLAYTAVLMAWGEGEALTCRFEAASLYGMRWGLELGFRAIKQTMQRRKLRSDAPVQTALELRWSVVSFSLLQLLGVRAILEGGGAPRTLSVAGALRTIRTVLRQPERRARPTRSLMRRLGGAVKDTYKRQTSKTARNWPHKKTERPPGRPRIRDANAVEVHAAQQLRAKHQAA